MLKAYSPSFRLWIVLETEAGVLARIRRDCRYLRAWNGKACDEPAKSAVDGCHAQTPPLTAAKPPAVRVIADTPPKNIEELIVASRAVTFPAMFEEFVRRMHRTLPGPVHQHQGLFTGMRV